MQNNIRETYSTTQIKWKKGSTTRQFGVPEKVAYLLYTCSILLNILVIVNSHKLRPMIKKTFKDTKGVIRSGILQNVRQYNAQT